MVKTPPEDSPKMALKRALRSARSHAGKTVQQAADAVEKSRQAIWGWERLDEEAPAPDEQDLAKLAALYGFSVRMLRSSDWLSREEPSASAASENRDSWEPNPSLARVLSPRVYEVALGYCRRLAAVGLPREDIEEAERLLIDEGYAKLNKRAKRVLTEDEQIEMIDVTWRIMKEALSWRGLKA